jgi:hypothetical protein
MTLAYFAAASKIKKLYNIDTWKHDSSRPGILESGGPCVVIDKVPNAVFCPPHLPAVRQRLFLDLALSPGSNVIKLFSLSMTLSTNWSINPRQTFSASS